MWQTIGSDARAGHPALLSFALASLVCAAMASVLILADPRTLMGAPLWQKPFKFFVSTGLYAATLAWYFGQVRAHAPATTGRDRAIWWLGTAAWTTLTIELALLVVQAARGVRSHFNIATPFDAAVFAAMGVMILTFSLIQVVLWVWLMRMRWADRARLSALRWGLGLTLGGLAIGGLMIQPTPEQVAAVEEGRRVDQGAHVFGGVDGGPGLPLVNWSTEVGDRRVAHFAGLHALQVLPLLLLALPAGWPEHARLGALRATGVAYGALVTLLVLQAQQARPLVRPGAALAGALLLVIVGWLVALLAVSRSARPSAAAHHLAAREPRVDVLNRT